MGDVKIGRPLTYEPKKKNIEKLKKYLERKKNDSGNNKKGKR